MINGKIEPNETIVNEQKAFDFNSIQISKNAGKNNVSGTMTKLNITMSEIVAKGLTDRRKAYANNKLSFQSACIGEKATYSLDSAHKGGAFFQSKDGIIFRFGQKGQIAVQEYIEQTVSAKLPDGE